MAAPHQSYKDVPGGEILTQFARGEVRDGLSTEPICLGDPLYDGEIRAASGRTVAVLIGPRCHFLRVDVLIGQRGDQHRQGGGTAPIAGDRIWSKRPARPRLLTLIVISQRHCAAGQDLPIGPDGELCNVGVLHRRCLRNGRITGKLADRGLFRCEPVQKSGTGGADGLKELGGRGCDPLKEGWVGIGADRQLGQTDAQQGQQAPEDQPAPEMRL